MQKAIKLAAANAGVNKQVSCHQYCSQYWPIIVMLDSIVMLGESL
jgi:hypothetical protein